MLKRREGERIIVDRDIIIEVLEIQGRFVRIGIVAPQEVPVDREEVRERKEQEARGT